MYVPGQLWRRGRLVLDKSPPRGYNNKGVPCSFTRASGLALQVNGKFYKTRTTVTWPSGGCRLTNPRRTAIIIEEFRARSPEQAVWLQWISCQNHDNRHLPEWRLSLFTRTVTVKPKTWNVKVIGICSPPFGLEQPNRLPSPGSLARNPSLLFYTIRPKKSTLHAKSPLPTGRGLFFCRWGSGAYTSWIIAISAASPRRGPSFSTRV